MTWMILQGSPQRSSSAEYVTDVESFNEARTTLFSRCRQPEALPPTSDVGLWHIRRAHFQAMIWKQALVPNPTLPLPETIGWTKLNSKLVPKLMSLAPVPAEAVMRLLSADANRDVSQVDCEQSFHISKIRFYQRS